MIKKQGNQIRRIMTLEEYMRRYDRKKESRDRDSNELEHAERRTTLPQNLMDGVGDRT